MCKHTHLTSLKNDKNYTYSFFLFAHIFPFLRFLFVVHIKIIKIALFEIFDNFFFLWSHNLEKKNSAFETKNLGKYIKRQGILNNIEMLYKMFYRLDFIYSRIFLPFDVRNYMAFHLPSSLCKTFINKKYSHSGKYCSIIFKYLSCCLFQLLIVEV